MPTYFPNTMTGTTDTIERPSILLVEDDRLTRTVLRHDLKLCGFDGALHLGLRPLPCLVASVSMRVLAIRPHDRGAHAVDIAENGDVALKKLQRPCRRGAQGYDLVLTDVFMPKVDGEALVKAILNSDFRNIPVAGAADYFFKPVRTSNLTRLKGLTSRRKELIKPRSKEVTEPQHSLLSISLLQAAQLLSSDSPTKNHGTALAQQLPPSPPSSTPSPSLQETNYALLGSVHGNTGSCRRNSPEAGVDTSAAAEGIQGGSKVSSIPVTKKAPTATKQCSHDLSRSKTPSKGAPTALQCATFLAESGIVAPLAARKAALARFRAKKARSHFAPKVRYHERKKLAEARPRYKGQFIKISTLSKAMQTGQGQVADAGAAKA